MNEEWTEAPQWESELLEEAFLNLFPSTGPFSSDLGMAASSPSQDYPLFLDPEMAEYDMTDRSFENIPAIEGHVLDMLASENMDTTLFQHAIPDPNISNGVAHQHLVLSPTLLVENDHPITTKPEATDSQAYLHEFDGGPKIGSPRRKRKQYSPNRRQEVSKLRKVGACLRCRLTKTSVRFLPCRFEVTSTDSNPVQARSSLQDVCKSMW